MTNANEHSKEFSLDMAKKAAAEKAALEAAAAAEAGEGAEGEAGAEGAEGAAAPAEGAAAEAAPAALLQKTIPSTQSAWQNAASFSTKTHGHTSSADAGATDVDSSGWDDDK